ncbi:MAG: lysophospholipid transporter LplT [Thiobacillus sp.]|uniref:lysophospholipid transporter LplT n=1 Tax=unclassified Thiobacillus TaxID=2646513 RepID=UPI00086DC81C|nr:MULTISPECIES: lysophospholipid transporter LplT [unclassified Thiobacillus]MBN8771149.1 lysophospholipid transporter LplT [Thiobacillus sp.]MBN8779638.1 lysophospholipid transporter LplT [Thiobacillus sp.]ODU99775.1 MAG: lysophospholipid transporter LplT [Thiobacillus sp. SCN 63-57]OJY54904.1 MAG: lysophospholipid transporter LplT [Thiobacillus sp. 0-1251]
MNRAFYTILLAQFLSALADNALLFAAIGLLVFSSAPEWYSPLLQTVFVIAYIVLAPLVGPFADALPKGRVMLIANTLKFAGCLTMLAGLHPLLAYAIVGIGAAMYSPAKYGILTELLPSEKLVVANSWMEGTTVAAIVLGAIIGGALINPHLAERILATAGLSATVIAPKFAIVVITGLYLGAAFINLFIPRLPIDHKLPNRSPLYILHDFGHSFLLLWRDPLGQVSLAVTTLFWGVGATLRLLIIAWAALNLKYGLDQATQLTAASAFGIAIGSILAGKFVRLQRAISVLPAGILLGFVPIALIWVESLIPAVLLLTLAGVLAGYFVVPMNALLQHRGHLLMGAGHSIAQQNFNENISILLLTGAYALMVRADWHIHTIVLVFGLFISTVMATVWLRHRNDVVH